MSKVVRLTENDLIRLVEKVILEHEQGDDVIIRYSDNDCEVKMKGILKEKQTGGMNEYLSFFTPVQNGFASFCGRNGYNPEAERFVSKMERKYLDSIGKDLVLRNLGGMEYGPDSSSFGKETMVTIQNLIPFSTAVTIKKY